MKKIIVAGFLAVSAILAHAGNVVDANATTTTNTQSTSGAVNSGVTLQNTFNSPDKTEYGGSYTVKSAPAIAAPAGYGSWSQQNCMVTGTGGFSIIGFGATGQVPIDGARCDMRVDQQNMNATAMTIHNFVAANPSINPSLKQSLDEKAAAMLQAAGDMSCLSSDRQRAVMEKKGLCREVADITTLDHRFGQPRSTQIDYSAGN
jgi:hypothetical protein